MTAPDSRLGEIEGRMAAATPGPWNTQPYGQAHEDDGLWVTSSAREVIADMTTDEGEDWEPQTRANMEFIAAAPADIAYLLAELRKRDEALGRVEKVRQDLFELSNDDGWTTETRAAYRDASRAIYTALRTAVAAATGGGDQ